MKEEKSNIDQFKRIAQMFHDNPDLHRNQIEERNKMADKLNEKTIRIMQTSPMYAKIVNGELEYDFDITTKELLHHIRNDNDRLLRKAFPDLYIINDNEDYEKEN